MFSLKLTPQHKLFAAVLVLLTVGYATLFHRLGSHPVMMWDESRLAVNAAEMLRSKSWLVTTYQGQPDLWNTKPPLLIWIQAALFAVLGPTELALRLPSASAALATAGLLFWFGYRHLGGLKPALFSSLVLLTADGYVEYHVARNGDYDALLVCWITAYTLFFFLYLEFRRPADWWRVVMFVTLAVLTKGVAGLLPMPALVLYALFTGKLLFLLKQKQFYLGMLGCITVVGLFYGLREMQAPGYLTAVYENELGGRLLSTLDEHQHPWDWYIDMIKERKFLLWLPFLAIGLLTLLNRGASPLQQRLIFLATLFTAIYLFVISSAQTKLQWYDAPLYPVAALVTGIGLATLCEAFLVYMNVGFAYPLVLAAFAAAVFYGPTTQLRRKLHLLYQDRYNERKLVFGPYLKAQQQAIPMLDQYTLFTSGGYNASMEFYALAAARKFEHRVRTRYEWQLNNLASGETVVVTEPELRARVDTLYNTIPVFNHELGSTLLIKGKR